MKTRIEKLQYFAPGNNCLRTRAIRTLLAEDSPLLMALLTRIVTKNQRVFIVGSATDGRKALCNASTLGPDLVITDLHMPGLDGAEVARRLKQLPNPPIIFVVTSDDTPEARARCLAAGADVFLVKAGNLAARLLSAIQEFFPDELDPNERMRSGATVFSPTSNHSSSRRMSRAVCCFAFLHLGIKSG